MAIPAAFPKVFVPIASHRDQKRFSLTSGLLGIDFGIFAIILELEIFLFDI